MIDNGIINWNISSSVETFMVRLGIIQPWLEKRKLNFQNSQKNNSFQQFYEKDWSIWANTNNI